MNKVLIVEASSRGDSSISRQLAQRFIVRWQQQNPQDQLTYRDLTDTQIPYINQEWLAAYFTPPEHQTEAMKAALQLSDTLVSELVDCDHLVISTPVYNYNIPANLKSWFDSIVRKGVTLGFDGQGLLQGKKATVLVAAGGVYGEDSPIKDRNIAQQYLKLVLSVVGIDDVELIVGEGAKAVDLGEATMGDFVGTHDSQISRTVMAASEAKVPAVAEQQ